VTAEAASAGTVKGLQERAARALPAELVEVTGGWWLRRAPGCSWWVESVLPHSEADLEELLSRVAEAEKFYAVHGSVARFQLTPRVCPPQLDALLAEREYEMEGSVSLQAARAADILKRLPPSPLRVKVEAHPTREWFETWHLVHGGDPRSEWKLLDRVRHPSGYAHVMVEDDIAAVGRAVADDGWTGVFGMATLPQARGKGAARCVLAALAQWAIDQHAENMYLQAENSNIPARRLYEQAGFTLVSEYHYRTAR
jgi:GNAT superfamily N-acetyltransferase